MKITYDSGDEVEIPDAIDLGFESYSQLIGYTLIHASSDRALFHPHQVATVLALAKENLEAVKAMLERHWDCGIEFFVTWRSPHADPVCAKADENLKEWNLE